MNSVTITAHFDGERILLDEPYELKPNTKLLVTVMTETDDERESWLRLSFEQMNRAYADNEPGYEIDALKQKNLGYEAK